MSRIKSGGIPPRIEKGREKNMGKAKTLFIILLQKLIIVQQKQGKY